MRRVHDLTRASIRVLRRQPHVQRAYRTVRQLNVARNRHTRSPTGGNRQEQPQRKARDLSGRPMMSAHETDETGLLDGLSDQAFDSYLLERAVLERGWISTRLRPEMFMAEPAQDQTSAIGFQHTAATTTSKVALELIADRQFQRAMLEEAGIATQRSWTASRYRALVTRTRPTAILLELDDGVRNVVDDIHAELVATLPQVLTTFPGLDHAEVRFGMDDHTESPTGQRFSITGMSVRPRLWRYEYSSESRPGEVSRRLLDALSPAHEVRPANPLTARVKVTTVGAAGRGQRNHVERTVADLGIRMIEPITVEGNTLAATIEGEPCCVAALTALVISEQTYEMARIQPIPISEKREQ